MHRIRRPRKVPVHIVAKLLLVVGAVIVLLAMPNWALIVFGLLLALVGWFILSTGRKRRRRRW